MYRFKLASEAWEFSQIARLNHHTFVEEIPQHEALCGAAAEREDPYHSENTYLICVRDGQVVGMLALRDKRPFSLEKKLPGLDSYLPPARSIVEMRLLSVRSAYRNGRILFGLMRLAASYCAEKAYDLAVISALVKNVRLYRRFGYIPFGPLVGTGKVRFQPMYLQAETFERLGSKLEVDYQYTGDLSLHSDQLSLLPGPVEMTPEVSQALASVPLSHRSPGFLRMFNRVQHMLCNLVDARQVQIFSGGGTLANDVVAGQLRNLPARGVILSNGEFGERLIDQARRFQLDFQELRFPWGERLDLDQVAACLDEEPRAGWLWMVHCETSSGILNGLDAVRELCRARGVHLCLDCISSVGAVPVGLRGVHLASCVSGKALSSYAGLAMVFHDTQPQPHPSLPSYLDLGHYAACGGVPFTLSSNLLAALDVALQQLDVNQRVKALRHLADNVREALRSTPFTLVAEGEDVNPAVITLAMRGNGHTSKEVGDRMRRRGFLMSYESSYLLKRNWLQICLMGRLHHRALQDMLQTLREVAQDTEEHPREEAPAAPEPLQAVAVERTSSA